MYPETDLPLLRIGRELVNEVKKELPKLRSEVRDELKKRGLSDELISLILDGYADEFFVLMKVYDKDATLVAKMVSLWRMEFASKMKKGIEEIEKVLGERELERLLELVRDGRLGVSDVRGVMGKILEGVAFDDAVKVEKVSDDELEKELRRIVAEKSGLRVGGYMGLAVQRIKGIDKKKAMELLQKIVGI